MPHNSCRRENINRLTEKLAQANIELGEAEFVFNRLTPNDPYMAHH